MPDTERDSPLTVLEKIIQEHPAGIGLQALIERYAAAGSKPMTDRTLQRRLSEMVARQVILLRGKTRGARYYPLAPSTPVDPLTAETELAQNELAQNELAQAEVYVALSTAGEMVRSLVRAPKSKRRPVGYEEEFLDAYQPGTTWYLPASLRTRLHQLGQTPEKSRPAGTYARDILERLLIDLAWASSKLEGNTYSRLDTQNLLDHGIRAEGSDTDETQMILNHKKAIEFLVEEAAEISFNRSTLCNIHAALSEGLLKNPRDEGRLRTTVVGITGTTFIPLSIPQKIEENFDIVLAKAADIPDAFEQSFFMMVHIPYLQPFTDVNKRTSRLAANISLIKQNLCPLSFVDVPDRAYVEGTLAIYEFNRVELLRDVYAWAYERSCEQYRTVQNSVVQPDPIRLRFREQLSTLIHDFVLDGTPPVRSLVLQWAEQHEIPEDVRARFVETALELLIVLHEGAIYRHRIKPSEFQAWKHKITQKI